MRPLWLYPLLLAICKGHKRPSDIAELIGGNGLMVKKLMYFARKFGLIDEDKNLTEEGKSFLSSFEVLWLRRGRMAIRGEDGCFVIFIRKRRVKALRVPCDEALENNNPLSEGKREVE